MRRQSSICVLVSGGLDSAALLCRSLELKRRLYPVYIHQGLAWEEAELFGLRGFLKRVTQARPVTVLTLPVGDVYGRHWSTGQGKVPGARTRDAAVYLPGRNLMLTLKAAVFCAKSGIHEVVLGSLDHNPFPDATRSFFRLWSRALSQGLGFRIRVHAPFRSMSKSALIRRYGAFPLHLSFSCIDPRGLMHCGRCNKCVERRRAFRQAGVKDQTIYVA